MTAGPFRNVPLFPDQQFSFDLNQTLSFHRKMPSGEIPPVQLLCVLQSLAPFINIQYEFRNNGSMLMLKNVALSRRLNGSMYSGKLYDVLGYVVHVRPTVFLFVLSCF